MGHQLCALIGKMDLNLAGICHSDRIGEAMDTVLPVG